VELRGKWAEDILPKILKLLQQRCFRTLIFINDTISDMTKNPLVSALTNSKCTFDHEHAELNHLELTSNITDADVPAICAFIKNGHGNHLQELIMRNNKITSCGISELCKVLNDVTCRELTYLNLSGNPIGDEGVRMLCYALIQGHCKLQRLLLEDCSLTADCMRYLYKVLCDEYCTLSKLSVKGNAIGDEGVRMLCTDALGREQCTLTSLNLCWCSLTANCIPALCEVLQDEHCKLSVLSLEGNVIGDEGVRMLCTDALRREQCTLISLNLGSCSLTAKCLPPLCEVLQSEHCKLSTLSLEYNIIGDEGVGMLCTDALRREQCKLIELFLGVCELTDQCVPLLCEALEDRNCKLGKLSLDFNHVTEKGLDLLRDCGERRGLKISLDTQYLHIL
jgi:Ran GTPase-activating protein (RanGAP) involved in mRNA processing and transport